MGNFTNVPIWQLRARVGARIQVSVQPIQYSLHSNSLSLECKEPQVIPFCLSVNIYSAVKFPCLET